jgi:HK97 family phage major capsid protein
MTATKAAPSTVADWESYLGSLDTPEKFTAAFNDGTFKENLTGYVNAQNKERADITDQVKEITQAALADLLRDQPQASGVKRLNLDAGDRPGDRHNPTAFGAPLDGVYPDFTALMQAVKLGARTPEDKARLEKITNYSEKVPSEGGFLVPEEFRTELLRLSMENAIVRPRATVVPMSNPRLNFPAIDETSRVSSVFGGIIVYRTEEGAELVESSAAFGSVKLDVTKQTALAHVTNEIVRDWGAFGAFISSTFPQAIAFFEDIDFISGNGAGQPLGGLHSANKALITVAKETNQTASTIVWENVLHMYARMLPSSMERAVWVASPDTFTELATMALTVGTGGAAVWIVDAAGTPRLTLLGRPVIMTEKAPAALGTQGDLSLVDWSMYLVGDYQMMTVDSSPHVKFTSDKTTYRVIQRNDGRPWLFSAITPHNNSASLSPFVQLATRS